MIVPNNFWLFLLLLCALLIFLEIASYSNSYGQRNKITLRPKVKPEKYLKTNQVTSAQKRKHILYWTPYFKAQDWQFGFGSKPFQNCPQPNCAGEKWNKYVFKPGLTFHVLFLKFIRSSSFWQNNAQWRTRGGLKISTQFSSTLSIQVIWLEIIWFN